MPATPDNRRPMLSVVIPNYNDSRFLERCLCSVVTQSRLPDEVIVYDDASTDGSVKLVKMLQERWPIVQLRRGERNLGVNGVMNLMLQEVTSEWVHFLAADDLPLPGFYQIAMQQAALHPQAGALFGAFVAYDEATGHRFTEAADKWVAPGFLPPKRILWKLFHKAPALFSLGYTNIWRVKPLLALNAFHPALGAYSDTVAFRCLVARHGGVYLSEAPLVCVRVSQDSYGGRVWRDIPAYASTMELAANLMRTRYADVFPEKYIRNWEAKVMSEIGLKPWPKWRRAKHAASWVGYRLWLALTRSLGR